MFGLPFLKKKNQSNKFLAVDINAGVISCLVFYKENGTAKVLGSASQKLPMDAVRNGTIIEYDDVLETLSMCIELASQDLEEKVTEVIFGISADLCIEKITTAKILRNDNNPIEKKEMSTILSKLRESAFNETQSEYIEKTGNPDAELSQVTSFIVYIKSDGHYTYNLEDSTGKRLEIAFYSAFCPNSHINLLNKLARNLKLNVLAICPETYSLSKALKHSALEANDYVLVDIGVDYTKVAVIFGGGIVSSKTLPLGMNHFIEEVGEIMGLTYIEAEKMVSSHLEKKLTQSESLLLQDCLYEVFEIWLSGLELTFQEFSKVKTFASLIYITGAGSELVEFLEGLNKEPWTKSIPFKAPPQIKKIELRDLEKLGDATGTVNANKWLLTFSLGAIFEELVQ